MKTLIVTASSKSKRASATHKFKYSGNRFTDLIEAPIQTQVIDARKELLDTVNLEPGPDVFPKKISESDPEFLPAYMRYSGRTYSKISDGAWKALVDNPDKWDCIILSALYGLVRYDEPIRSYPIKQADKLQNKSTIAKYWTEKGASDWLYNYIKQNEIEDVKFVLSTQYAGIVKRDELIPRLKDELDVIGEDKQFKTSGRASMLLRGQYIDELLKS